MSEIDCQESSGNVFADPGLPEPDECLAKTKLALQKQLKHNGGLNVTELFGTVDVDPDYDYKAERTRKRG